MASRNSCNAAMACFGFNLSMVLMWRVSMWPVWKSKFYDAFNHSVVLHAIDATPARWLGDADSSPLDGTSAATPSPRHDLVKNCRVHPAHWLISTQDVAEAAGDREDRLAVALGQRLQQG